MGRSLVPGRMTVFLGLALLGISRFVFLTAAIYLLGVAGTIFTALRVPERDRNAIEKYSAAGSAGY